MSYPEVIIPPWVQPVTGVEPTLQDDQSVVFSPRFGRGASQRQAWGDPTWAWKAKYQGLSQSARAAMQRAVLGARGKAANIRLTPGLSLRGSFPAAELFVNNDFQSGTTGWSNAQSSIAATDGAMRISATSGPIAYIATYQVLTLTQYAPYVVRSFIVEGQNSAGISIGNTFSTGYVDSYSATRGMRTCSETALSSSSLPQYSSLVVSTSGYRADMAYGILWTSISRCALVDNGANLLTYSDQLDNGAWSGASYSVSANSATAPDGTATADTITSSNSAHFVGNSATVTASGDYTATIYLKTGSNSWGITGLTDNVLGGVVESVNLSSGALGTVATGSGWSNGRATIDACGNGWYRVCVTGRKTGASTSCGLFVKTATADATPASSGTIIAWRGSLAAAAVPSRGCQTTSTASTTGTSQTGAGVYVKGLPASTAGLLLAGDFIEINGELKRCTAQLDSDAAGLGYLQFAPSLVTAPADNDPVIINNPMGRFVFASDPRVTENYGLYTDFEIDLVESYS